jgi:GAF domain
MPTGLWRFLALAGAFVALVFVIADSVEVRSSSNDHVLSVPADGRSYARQVVISVTGTTLENGGLQPGDVIVPLFPYTTRVQLGDSPAGTAYHWSVERGTKQFLTTSYVSALGSNDIVLGEIFNAVRLAMILMAMVVAARRPDVAAARALVTFLAVIGLTLSNGGGWLPDAGVSVWYATRGPLEIYSLSQGLLFACIFPFASITGPRAWLQRINPWYAALTACMALVLNVNIVLTNTAALPKQAVTFINWSPMAFFFGFTIAFWIATVQATGRDRQRVYWAAGSIGCGFAGPIVVTIAEFGFHYNPAWVPYLALTLIAIPVGLAYTILRHRTVDIGFVISRALVLTVLSAIIVVVFGLLERLLGKLFIDASHIASRSVEIALALGLGFSLRSLHARIERIIDRLFFRHRQRALATLKTFADDVYFITDPDVALERTVDTVFRCADAENAAIYLIADGAFGCASIINSADLPAELSADDPLFVRLRATRLPQIPREVGSGLNAEIAFPMFVRATLVGALVLAAKRSGEAYDPEENALLTELAQRVGLALDALQTIAMRRELESLMGATGGASSAL